MVCYSPAMYPSTWTIDTTSHIETCQDIVIALLDDTLLDYRNTFPFQLVVDIALYLLLEENYLKRQLGTYALLRLEETYHSPDFILAIHDLYTNNHQDFARYLYGQYCSRAPKVVNSALLLHPTLFHGTGFFWGEP